MSIVVKFSQTASDFVAQLEAVRKEAIKAVVPALNKTGAHIRTHAGRTLAHRKDMPVAKVKKRIKMRKATYRRPRVVITGLVLPMRLSDIGAGRQTRTGVTVRGSQYPHAFKATMSSGKSSIFRRKTTKRLPIAHVTVPLMPEAKVVLSEQVKRSHRTEFPKFLKHETERRLARRKARL